MKVSESDIYFLPQNFYILSLIPPNSSPFLGFSEWKGWIIVLGVINANCVIILNRRFFYEFASKLLMPRFLFYSKSRIMRPGPRCLNCLRVFIVLSFILTASVTLFISSGSISKSQLLPFVPLQMHSIQWYL